MNTPTPGAMNATLETARKVREAGEVAISQLSVGHRSESMIQDLLTYTNQLRNANARHVLNHIESICEMCGRTKTEDGCAFCIKQYVEPLVKALEEISKPALGDKVQQWKAAEALRAWRGR